MVTNLDYVITSSTTLDPITSDVATSVTLDVATETPTNHTIWAPNGDADGAAGIDIVRSYADPGAQCMDYEGNNWPCGTYYNWYTATAKTGTYSSTSNATMSICPRGWTLPTVTKNTNLFIDSYGLVDKDKDSMNKVRMFPLSFVPAGVYRGDLGSLAAKNSNGYYWTKTYTSTSTPLLARNLGFYNDGVNWFASGASSVKYRGYNVRCISL